MPTTGTSTTTTARQTRHTAMTVRAAAAAMALVCTFVIVSSSATRAATCPLPGCTVYADNHCAGNAIVTNASFDARRWATPARTDTAEYVASYQDYSRLVAYAVLQYADAETMTEATVTIRATHKSPTVTLSYTFGSGSTKQTNNSKTFTTAQVQSVA